MVAAASARPDVVGWVGSVGSDKISISLCVITHQPYQTNQTYQTHQTDARVKYPPMSFSRDEVKQITDKVLNLCKADGVEVRFSGGERSATRFANSSITANLIEHIVLSILVLGSRGDGSAPAPRPPPGLAAPSSPRAALALLALLLAAVLGLMARPGTAASATLAGVELADVVPVDRAAFGMESATIHLLTQPVLPGAQTLVVRLDGRRGRDARA